MGENNIRYGELLKVLHETVARINDKANAIARSFVPRECVMPQPEKEAADPTDNVFDAVKNEIVELNKLDSTLDEIIKVL